MNKALASVIKYFERENGDLLVGGKKVADIIKDASTPVYIYDRSILQKKHAELRKVLPADLKIDYAIKANPNLEILKECAPLYDGFDVASIGEFRQALAASIEPQLMSFAGPGKSIPELTEAVTHDIGTISAESERELEHLTGICKKVNKKIKVLIRINPEFELSKSGMKMGGGPKQFGIDSELVPALIEKYSDHDWIQICGIHIYAGSQNLNAEAIVTAYEKIANYAAEIKRTTSIKLDIVNLGGGFGIPYWKMDEALDIDAVGRGVKKVLDGIKPKLPNTQFKIELGRFIVGECGLYATKVLYRKISREQVFVIINGGMHHHLAASGNFGQKLVHRPMPMTIANALNAPLEKVNIVGPLCTPLDTFGVNVEIPKADEDDVLVVFNSGAYGFSASPQGFLSHEPPVEMLV
jgi:diaminopimelate decarboxylase